MNENTPVIQQCKDYKRFDLITGNRNVNLNKIDRIIDDIENGLNLLPYCPILVYSDNDKLRIIDVQHRFEVSKQIKSPVFYIETNLVNLKQIALINSRQDKWTELDFLRCYVKIGIEDYLILEKIFKEFKISISTLYSLLMTFKINSRGEVGQLFRDGEFKVKFEAETTELLSLTDTIFGRYNFSKDRKLITAIQQLQTKGLCDFKHLEEKVSEAPMIMDKQGTVKDYIFNIERVYNHKKQTRQIIF